jgi:hypothetical protein
MKLELAPSTFDWLVQLHVVNQTNNETTIQQIEAEVEIEGKTVKLKPSRLENYEMMVDDSGKSTTAFSRHIFSRREPLASLWASIKGVPLRRGVGYDGWVAFEMVVDPHTKHFPMQVYLVDALEGRHFVQDDPRSDDREVIVHASAMQP